jgi:outer membrane biosynthesis protein TonB
MNPAEDASAEALLSSLKTIAASERRKHASVFNYWLSIRRDRQFPPIRDLDPLEISDAGPHSVLLEMIGAEDADIRHVGQAIKLGIDAEKLSDAPSPSLLSCIATRIPIVAACKEAFAFEDEFETDGVKTRCWVTLLPFSATGAFIDYVYGFVSLDPPPAGAEDVEEAAETVEEVAEPVEAEAAEETADAMEEAAEPEPQPEEPAPEPVAEIAPEPEPEPEPEAIAEEPVQQRPGFSAKLLESLANVSGFYGKNVQVDPDVVPMAAEEPEEIVEEPAEEIAEQPVEEIVEATVEDSVEETAAEEAAVHEPAEEPPLELTESPTPPSVTGEATLQDKLTDVRAKADEARAAKLRANVALYEGLSAAYDFALDAEDSPEEYLRLVEAQGLKIQLRSPMKPVVKLAFDGLCDEATIKQLEAILAWAFDEELPRGSLAERIEAAGGIGPILNGQARAA